MPDYGGHYLQQNELRSSGLQYRYKGDIYKKEETPSVIEDFDLSASPISLDATDHAHRQGRGAAEFGDAMLFCGTSPKKSRAKKSSRHFGVRFRPDLNKWVAEIRVAEWKAVDKKVWLGTYESEVGAARAVDAARKLLKCKKKRSVNFPCESLDSFSEQIPGHLNLNNLRNEAMFKDVTLFVKRKAQEYATSFSAGGPASHTKPIFYNPVPELTFFSEPSVQLRTRPLHDEEASLRSELTFSSTYSFENQALSSSSAVSDGQGTYCSSAGCTSSSPECTSRYNWTHQYDQPYNMDNSRNLQTSCTGIDSVSGLSTSPGYSGDCFNNQGIDHYQLHSTIHDSSQYPSCMDPLDQESFSEELVEICNDAEDNMIFDMQLVDLQSVWECVDDPGVSAVDIIPGESEIPGYDFSLPKPLSMSSIGDTMDWLQYCNHFPMSLLDSAFSAQVC